MAGGDALVRALEQRGAWPHPVGDIRVLETHISWVVLTGRYAYKIKKPIRLEFLDFSTLALRRHWCEEELRLNSRWAPSIYLGVVPITGTIAAPVVGGDGEALEYAVKMQQFPQSALLSADLEAGRLDRDDMRRVAEMIADRHRDAPVSHDARFGSPEAVVGPMRDNLRHLEPQLEPALLKRLEDWTETSFARLRPVIAQRSAEGFVRECHGDLHLNNLVRLPEGIVAFDSIEFSDELRMLDVISDLSFLTMDLVAGGRPDLAAACLNRYLECSGDYAGMALYRLYFVYHCLIRAKVDAIRAAEREDAGEADADRLAMRHYVDVASNEIDDARPALVVMHGLSGSGKTHVSSRLVERLGAVRVRSDIERKRMHGLREFESSGSAPGAGLYTQAESDLVYERLFQLASLLLDAGHRVILDAAFLKRAERERAASIAEEAGAACIVVAVEAAGNVLEARLRARSTAGGDASEAGVDVLRMQYGIVEPTAGERAEVVRFRNEKGADTDALADTLVARLGPASS